MVLKQDGSVWITGDNEYGQIGDLTFVNKKSFLQVSRKGPCGDVVYRLVSNPQMNLNFNGHPNHCHRIVILDTCTHHFCAQTP